MRWVLRIAIVLLAAGALRAVLGTDDAPATTDVDAVLEAPDPADGPELARAPPVEEPPPRPVAAPADRVHYDPLPARIQKHLQDFDAEATDGVWTWIKAHPPRFLDVLAAAAKLPPVRGTATVAAQGWARTLVRRLDMPYHPTLRDVLLDTIAKERHRADVMAGILAALKILTTDTETSWASTLVAVARSPVQAKDVRLRAAADLLWNHDDLPAGTAEALQAVLALEGRLLPGSLATLLSRLLEHPALLRACLPQLIALAERGRVDWAAEDDLLRALIASGDRRPAVLRIVAKEAWSLHGSLRTQAADALYGGDVEAVLAWLEEAPPHARIIGVSQMFARGVAPERLHAHVLAVLGSSHGLAIQRAVDAIPLVGVPEADVLRAAEPLLAHEDVGRQKLGVKALGALARVAGTHDDALRRLARIAREASSPGVRVVAVQSILMHQRRPRLMVEALGGMLGDTEVQVRREAIDGLGELAAQHPEARRFLEGARNDSDDDVRALIAYWLDETDTDDD